MALPQQVTAAPHGRQLEADVGEQAAKTRHVHVEDIAVTGRTAGPGAPLE
jgi:hypothetical protein